MPSRAGLLECWNVCSESRPLMAPPRAKVHSTIVRHLSRGEVTDASLPGV